MPNYQIVKIPGGTGSNLRSFDDDNYVTNEDLTLIVLYNRFAGKDKASMQGIFAGCQTIRSSRFREERGQIFALSMMTIMSLMKI